MCGSWDDHIGVYVEPFLKDNPLLPNKYGLSKEDNSK